MCNSQMVACFGSSARPKRVPGRDAGERCDCDKVRGDWEPGSRASERRCLELPVIDALALRETLTKVMWRPIVISYNTEADSAHSRTAATDCFHVIGKFSN